MINENRLEKAMRFLAETDERAAELRADVDRSEYKAKVMKAACFTHLEGTVAEREAKALQEQTVMDAYMAHFKAISDYHKVANKRQLEMIVVELYRTICANRRQGNLT